MNIASIFPVAVGMYTMPNKLSDSELKFLLNTPTRSNVGNRTSENSYVLNSQELTNLREELLKIARNYFKIVYAPQSDVDIYITQSWVNTTKPKQFHHEHSHQNSFLSGVLYVNADNKTDNITFHKLYSIAGGIGLHIEPTEWNVYNSKKWQYSISSGDVFIFPSELTHGVDPTSSGEDRISLAFNMFLKGSIGTEKDLTKLNLFKG
jgi:uncharacterized protein (TIGR02466 family)